jgi:hypothetical protein
VTVVCEWTTECTNAAVISVVLTLGPEASHGADRRQLPDEERSVHVPVCGVHRDTVERWIGRKKG